MNKDLNKLIDFLKEKGIKENEYTPYLNALSKQLKDKKYGLVWEEKEEDVYNQLLNKLPILKEVPEKAILTDEDKPVNLLIEGDNLHSLKSLVYTHKGKVDVIYIDPPYNTGNKDFIYNDKFVDKEDSWRHSQWLSFMNKRLLLARELLSNKGIIFISIDDNEHAQLKLLCDEIFGENNKLGVLSIVNNLKGRSDDKFFATSNEFMLVYGKNKELAYIKGFSMSEEYKKEYKFKDEISNYKEVLLRKTGKNSKREDRPNMYYPIYFDTETKVISLKKTNNPYEIEILPLDDKGNEGCWRWGIDKFNKKKDTELVVKLNNKNKWNVYVKMRDIVDGEVRTQKPKTIWINPKYDSGNGTVLIKEMFNKNVFTNPKPLDFILDVLRISTNKDSIILDFFAGSATTGQAALELNKEDDGNRQFILCTNNESNICEEVTYQRLDKIINGYKNSKGEDIEGLSGNLKYHKVELHKDEIDEDDTVEKLIGKCTDLITIKENCYGIDKFDGYDIIYNKNKAVLIYKDALPFSSDIINISKKLNKYNVKEKFLYSVYTEGIELDGITLKEFPIEIIEKIKTRSVK